MKNFSYRVCEPIKVAEYSSTNMLARYYYFGDKVEEMKTALCDMDTNK